MVKKFSKKRCHQIYRLKSGEKVAGASTISKVGESQDFLLNWYWKLGLDGLDPKKVTEESAHIGTVTHGLIQCHFQGDEASFSDEFSQGEINKGTQLFEKFLRVWEEQGLTWQASELSLVSEQYRYGGCLDLIAYNRNKLLTLADTKTSPRIYGNMYRQVSGYKNLYEENYSVKIERCVIIRLDKTDPELTETRWLGSMDKHFEVFKKQVALFEAFKQL